MFTTVLRASVFLLLSVHALAATRTNSTIRTAAAPRFFGAAANTGFLFIDKNYTKVARTQVS